MPRIWVGAFLPVNTWAMTKSSRGDARQAQLLAPASSARSSAPRRSPGPPRARSRCRCPASPCANARPGADADADRPIADEGEDHRHPRVVEAAQHAGADHLRPVDDLEHGGDGRNDTPSAITRALAGVSSRNRVISSRGKAQISSAITRHEADAEDACRPAGPGDAVPVAAAIGTGRPAPSPPGQAPSGTMNDSRRDLQRDRVRRDRIARRSGPSDRRPR